MRNDKTAMIPSLQLTSLSGVNGILLNPSMRVSTPQTIQPYQKINPIAKREIARKKEIFLWCFGISPNTICPPSVCPIGIRFIAVMKNPIQPAKATG